MMNLSFEEALEPYLVKLKDMRVLVAFSGGKDSLSLLDFLNRNKESISLSLYACHVNHGLRAEAAEDEEFCRSFCKSAEIPFFAENVGNALLNDKCLGIEGAARRHRYGALKKRAELLSCHRILTAHTFDDQIESFFTDVYTGASIFTLGGIVADDGLLMRIMLDVRTCQVEDYIKRKKLLPVFDKSNTDIRFVRNKMRISVLPTLYGAGGDFIPTVLRLQKDSIRLNSYFAKKVEQAIIFNQHDIVEIDRKLFDNFEEIEKEYLLGSLFSSRFRFSKKMINEALNIFSRNGSRRVDLGGGFCFEASALKIRLFKKYFLDTFLVEKEAGIDSIDVSCFRIKFKKELAFLNLTVRSRLPGDRLPCGRKLKDAFIDKKIDLFNRDRACVVVKDGIVVWAEGLNLNNESVEFERLI